MIGIYKIENLINGKLYVGQSTNIQERYKSHIRSSKNPKSRDYNSALHCAFRKYGISNFKITILEICNKELLNEREIFWINQLNTFNEGYNETLGGDKRSCEGDNHPNKKLTSKDVIDIRNRYANHERKKVVFNLYKNKIGKRGFHKIWIGETWKNIMMDVYTPENINFHKHNSGNRGEENGRTKLSNVDVINIRRLHKEGVSSSIIYKSYSDKITYKSFINIISNQNWNF